MLHAMGKLPDLLFSVANRSFDQKAVVFFQSLNNICNNQHFCLRDSQSVEASRCFLVYSTGSHVSFFHYFKYCAAPDLLS